MSQKAMSDLTLDDHKDAFTEISFLLDIFASTVTDMMGGATASVGRIAGRQMARKIPLYLPDRDLESVLSGLKEKMDKGFDFDFSCSESGADFDFRRCAIRDVCLSRDKEVGKEVCELFHFYFDGIVNELTGRPTKSTLLETGDSCRTRMEMR